MCHWAVGGGVRVAAPSAMGIKGRSIPAKYVRVLPFGARQHRHVVNNPYILESLPAPPNGTWRREMRAKRGLGDFGLLLYC